LAQAAGPPLLFGLRLWASVCLALFVAFWLQLDEPNWGGMGAAIACLPSWKRCSRPGGKMFAPAISMAPQVTRSGTIRRLGLA
jgi:hypothetical protein